MCDRGCIYIIDYFIEHGTVDELQQFCNIDIEGLRLLFAGLLEEEEQDED